MCTERCGTARLVSGTRKYDRGLSQILHADLHWLDVADQVRYKLAVIVHRCLNSKAPKYLADCCVAVNSDCAQHIVSSWTCHVINAVHSAVAHFLSLPDELRDDIEDSCFGQSLKTLLFSVSTSVPSALGMYLYTKMRYINRRFIVVRTYLLHPRPHVNQALFQNVSYRVLPNDTFSLPPG